MPPLVPFVLPSQILDSDGALAFVCFSFFFYILYLWLRVLDSVDHTVSFSIHVKLLYRIVYAKYASFHGFFITNVLTTIYFNKTLTAGP